MATLTEYLLNEASKKYAEAVELSEIESKNDPEDNPYKSLYKTREILMEIKSSVDSFNNIGESSAEENLTFTLVVAALQAKLGTNYVETEELSSGEEHLMKSVSLLEPLEKTEKTCFVIQFAYNQLGILWCGRSSYQKAFHFLEKSEKVYVDFKHNVGGTPSTFDDIFFTNASKSDSEKERDRSNEFESQYTHTLYYLAQVYGKMEQPKKSAELCHKTLQRQLKSKKYDPVDWALNAATLSQYYITQNNYLVARHCLAAATRVFEEVGDLRKPPEESPDLRDKREKLLRHTADIERCWAKYGLALLEYSQDRLLKRIEEKVDNPFDKSDVDQSGEIDHSLRFKLELTSYESMITFAPVSTYKFGRDIFLLVQRWLSCAKEFYTLDDYCSDYVELVQDHSRLFKLLAFFEMSFEKQSKMHKRRADMLSDVLKELNPQHYLLICRQLIYEIAETYSTMLDCKLAVVENAEPEEGQERAIPSAHAARKINQLALQSIGKYEEYLETLKDAKKVFPDKLNDDCLRPALVAKFCIGRLYSKIIEPVVSKRLLNMKQSVENYQFLVSYCKRHPEACEVMSSELEICEEMVALLPAKMDRILQASF